jgi:hypothetical protein
MAMTDAQTASDVHFVASLSKFFASVLGLLYLFGFLVVASYLSRYGVSSFSVLQLQYLVAGIWLLAPPAVYLAVTVTGRRFEKRVAPEIVGGFNWRRFAVSTLLAGIPSSLFLTLLVLIPGVVEGMTWGIFWRLFLFYLAMVGSGQMFWMSRQADTSKETPWLNRSHAAPFYLILLLMIALLYAVWFSKRIYPLIPFSFGGGKPLTVVFIEGEKKIPDEIQKTDGSAKRSIPYKLLLSTDKYYVVVSPSPKERSLEVSRDAVAGIIVLQ